MGIGESAGLAAIQELPDLDKPLIAAVNVMAVGGGSELAISCDLILASTTARFGPPEINAATIADAASIRLPKHMPHHVSRELLLAGRFMEAEEARRWGIVNEVVEPDGLLARLGTRPPVASGPPLVFAAIKDSFANAARGLRVAS